MSKVQCPKCNGEAAQRLHCTKETLELTFREKTNDEHIQTILEHPSDCPQVNAFRLSELVDETPFVELNYCMCTGPTANCAWSLDNRKFISIQQILDRMKSADTLTPCVPDLFNQVQRTTSLSHRGLCDELRPIVNTPGISPLTITRS